GPRRAGAPSPPRAAWSCSITERLTAIVIWFVKDSTREWRSPPDEVRAMDSAFRVGCLRGGGCALIGYYDFRASGSNPFSPYGHYVTQSRQSHGAPTCSYTGRSGRKNRAPFL